MSKRTVYERDELASDTDMKSEDESPSITDEPSTPPRKRQRTVPKTPKTPRTPKAPHTPKAKTPKAQLKPESDGDTKPDTDAGGAGESNGKTLLAERVVMAGIKSVLASIKEEAGVTGLSEMQIRNQLKNGRWNVRKKLLEAGSSL